MSIQSYEDAICNYEEAIATYQETNPVKASTLYVSRAQCLLNCREFNEALVSIRLALEMKRELNCDADDLAYSCDVCASMYVEMSQPYDVIIVQLNDDQALPFLEEEITLLIQINDMDKLYKTAVTLFDILFDCNEELKQRVAVGV